MAFRRKISEAYNALVPGCPELKPFEEAFAAEKAAWEEEVKAWGARHDLVFSARRWVPRAEYEAKNIKQKGAGSGKRPRLGGDGDAGGGGGSSSIISGNEDDDTSNGGGSGGSINGGGDGVKRKRSSAAPPLRADGCPRKPLSSYNLWRRDVVDSFREKHPKLEHRKLEARLQQAWRDLPEAERETYVARGTELRVAWEAECDAWEAARAAAAATNGAADDDGGNGDAAAEQTLSKPVVALNLFCAAARDAYLASEPTNPDLLAVRQAAIQEWREMAASDPRRERYQEEARRQNAEREKQLRRFREAKAAVPTARAAARAAEDAFVQPGSALDLFCAAKKEAYLASEPTQPDLVAARRAAQQEWREMAADDPRREHYQEEARRLKARAEGARAFCFSASTATEHGHGSRRLTEEQRSEVQALVRSCAAAGQAPTTEAIERLALDFAGVDQAWKQRELVGQLYNAICSVIKVEAAAAAAKAAKAERVAKAAAANGRERKALVAASAANALRTSSSRPAGPGRSGGGGSRRASAKAATTEGEGGEEEEDGGKTHVKEENEEKWGSKGDDHEKEKADEGQGVEGVATEGQRENLAWSWQAPSFVRPASGFDRYCAEMRPIMRARHPKEEPLKLNERLRQMWIAEPEERKETFNAPARAERARFTQEQVSKRTSGRAAAFGGVRASLAACSARGGCLDDILRAC